MRKIRSFETGLASRGGHSAARRWLNLSFYGLYGGKTKLWRTFNTKSVSPDSRFTMATEVADIVKLFFRSIQCYKINGNIIINTVYCLIILIGQS